MKLYSSAYLKQIKQPFTSFTDNNYTNNSTKSTILLFFNTFISTPFKCKHKIKSIKGQIV